MGVDEEAGTEERDWGDRPAQVTNSEYEQNECGRERLPHGSRPTASANRTNAAERDCPTALDQQRVRTERMRQRQTAPQPTTNSECEQNECGRERLPHGSRPTASANRTNAAERDCPTACDQQRVRTDRMRRRETAPQPATNSEYEQNGYAGERSPRRPQTAPGATPRRGWTAPGRPGGGRIRQKAPQSPARLRPQATAWLG